MFGKIFRRKMATVRYFRKGKKFHSKKFLIRKEQNSINNCKKFIIWKRKNVNSKKFSNWKKEKLDRKSFLFGKGKKFPTRKFWN